MQFFEQDESARKSVERLVCVLQLRLLLFSIPALNKYRSHDLAVVDLDGGTDT